MFEMKLKELFRLGCIFLISGVSVANGNYQPLLNHIPESANVLVLIDVSAIQNSRIGAAQHLRDRYEMAYLDHAILLPPSARRAVIAGDLDTRRLNLFWGLSVIQLLTPANMDKMAQREDGLLDTLVGKKTILSPLDAYFIELETRMMATIYPARRQFACRWLRSRENNTTLSAYLQKAAGYTKTQGNDIVMALDLKDVPSPFHMANAIESSKVLAGTDFEVEKLTKLMSSIEGITLIIKADEKLSGKITVHFSENTFSIKEYAKDLLLEFLSKTGADVNDFDDWQANVVGKVVILEGDMTLESLRRILSLIEIPTPTSNPATDPKGPKAEDSVQHAPLSGAEKSQTYLQTVRRYVEDLREQAKGKSGHPIAVWMEKYAIKIENLPILDIDEDLQNYGANVAHYLRTSGDQLRTANLSSQAKQARYHEGRSATRYGRYSGLYGSYTNRLYQAGERKRVAIEEKEKGFGRALDVFREIDTETSKIRILLTQRYQVDF